MVEQKELVTLFKIKKLDDEYEALIPFTVVEGIYNEENYTFMTKDGIVYPHIEETIYPNIGYANRTITEIDMSIEKDEFGSIDFEMERKLNMDNAKKYLRLSSEPNKIYIKSNFMDGLQLLLDEESKSYQEQQLKNVTAQASSLIAQQEQMAQSFIEQKNQYALALEQAKSMAVAAPKNHLTDAIDELESDFNSMDENEAIEKIKNWIEST